MFCTTYSIVKSSYHRYTVLNLQCRLNRYFHFYILNGFFINFYIIVIITDRTTPAQYVREKFMNYAYSLLAHSTVSPSELINVG